MTSPALLAYQAGSLLARTLPGPIATATSRAAGFCLTVGMPGRRQTVERHLQRLHGRRMGGLELRRAVHRTFDSYARYWLESFRLPGMTPADLDAGMTAEGIPFLDEALAGGNGVVMALPHLGGWDFGGAWLATQGYPITVVVEPLHPPELFEWFAEFRRTLGLTVVPLGPDAGRTVLRALRRNEVVGLLCDRDIDGSGVGVDFFGERTTLPGGPVTLALRTGAPVLPTAAYFDGRGHRGVIRPPLALERSGSLRDDVATGTQLLADALQELIAHAPEQWHVLQPNWPSDRAVAPATG
ncbi:MAG: phosphatidylinositol mannoside acyltransferase [Acidimicrobiales bacterium]